MERWYLLITEKSLFWTFRRWEIQSFFEPKSWWKDYIYWLLESSCFELFRGGKCGLFLKPKCRWKDDIYWLLKSSCFELYGDGKYGILLSQKVEGKMRFAWSFWAFHDIPGHGKYGFSCSVEIVVMNGCAHSGHMILKLVVSHEEIKLE